METRRAQIEEAAQRASQNVPKVIRRFIRAEGINQGIVGRAVGMKQQDLSYRLSHPSAFSYLDLVRIAACFGVPVTTLFKDEADALADLYAREAKGAYAHSVAA